MKSANKMNVGDDQAVKQEQDNEKVMHNYHDYASEVEGGKESPGDLRHMEEHMQSSGMNHSGEQNFPVKLHYMLNELEKDGMDDIVSWQPHGRCFLVHKQQQFVEQVLPLWFRQTKFPSFQRQLNLYGFKRLTSGRDKGAYYHELFLRSKRFLSRRIQRIKIKGTGARKPGSPETEPNFYIASFLPSTSTPSKNAQASMVSNMMASGPTMHLGNRGSLSLQQLLAFPTFPALGASLPHQAQFAPPPLFHGSANHLVESHQTQAHLQHLRMARLRQEMQVLTSFGQQYIPMVLDHHTSPSALALSGSQPDPAAFANAPGYWRGYL